MPKGPRRPIRFSWPVYVMMLIAMILAVLVGGWFGLYKTL